MLTFVDETLQEEFVNVVIFDSLRHFLEKVPRLAWRHLLNIDCFVTARAKLSFLKKLAIVWTILNFLLFYGVTHFLLILNILRLKHFDQTFITFLSPPFAQVDYYNVSVFLRHFM